MFNNIATRIRKPFGGLLCLLAICAAGAAPAAGTCRPAGTTAHFNQHSAAISGHSRASAIEQKHYGRFAREFNRKYSGAVNVSLHGSPFGRTRRGDIHAGHARFERGSAHRRHYAPARVYYVSNDQYIFPADDQPPAVAPERALGAATDKPRYDRMDTGDYRIGYQSYKAGQNQSGPDGSGETADEGEAAPGCAVADERGLPIRYLAPAATTPGDAGAGE